MIAIHSITRIAAMFLVLMFSMSIQDELIWKSLIISIGMGHYLIAFWYARNHLIHVVNQVDLRIPFALLCIGAFLLYWDRFSLVIYFGFHHVFNEVYLLNRINKNKKVPKLQYFRNSSIFLNIFIYIIVLRNDSELAFIGKGVMYGGLGVSLALFAYYFMEIRKQMKFGELLDNCIFEVLGFVLIAASFFVEIKFLHVVLYHFFFWMFYPVPRMLTHGKNVVRNYIGLTLVCTVPFIIASPIGIVSYDLKHSLFYALFIIGSYVHITLSYALSDSHPNWILRIFNPKAALARST